MTAPALTQHSGRSKYPKGAIDTAIIALEAARPDTKEDGAVRAYVDDALRRLYRACEIEEGGKAA